MKTHEASSRMKAAKVIGEISGRRNSTNWQVEFSDELQMWNFRARVAQIGGFKTGHGTWILCPLYSYDDLKDRTKDFQKDFIAGLPKGIPLSAW